MNRFFSKKITNLFRCEVEQPWERNYQGDPWEQNPGNTEGKKYFSIFFFDSEESDCVQVREELEKKKKKGPRKGNKDPAKVTDKEVSEYLGLKHEL